MKILLLLFCLGLARLAAAQWLWYEQQPFYLGGQLGISASFGSHQNRLGLIARAFVGYDRAQLNVQQSFYWNFRSFGAQKKAWESHTRIGALLAWGRRDSLHDWRQPFSNEVSNQSGRPFGLGYSYIFYHDNQATKQRAGTLAFHARRFSFLMENDFLSFIAQDRYRTGSVALAYYLPQTQTSLFIKHISYTGDPYGAGSVWVRDKTLPSLWGYMDMSKVPYGNRSIGSLTLGFEQSLGYFQSAGLDIGIDAEQIRNAMQNEFIHDNPAIPANWGDDPEGKNPHIPMLDRQGLPYLRRPEQKIRKPKFYLQTALNGSLFY